MWFPSPQNYIRKCYTALAHNGEQTFLMGIMGNELIFLIFGHFGTKCLFTLDTTSPDERYKLSYVNLNHLSTVKKEPARSKVNCF